MRRVPKVPPPAVGVWLRTINATVKQHRMRVPADHAVKLAALFTLLGNPTEAVVAGAYLSLVPLFFDKMRVSRWGTTLDLISPDRETVLRLSQCCVAFHRRAGRNMISAKFQLDQVVGVMVRIHDPEAYVQRCWGAGFREVGTMFHPNTFEHSRKRMRGALGVLARDAMQQGEQLEEVIEVVSE